MKPMDVSVSTAEDRNDWDFTNVLRDCLNGAIIVIDGRREGGGLQSWPANRSARLEAGSVRGKCADALPAPLVKLIEKTFSSGKPAANCEFTLPGGGHGDLTIRANATPMGQKRGKVSGVVVVLS